MTYELTYIARDIWYAECTLCQWACESESISKAHDDAIRHLRTAHA